MSNFCQLCFSYSYFPMLAAISNIQGSLLLQLEILAELRFHRTAHIRKGRQLRLWERYAFTKLITGLNIAYVDTGVSSLKDQLQFVERKVQTLRPMRYKVEYNRRYMNGMLFLCLLEMQIASIYLGSFCKIFYSILIFY